MVYIVLESLKCLSLWYSVRVSNMLGTVCESLRCMMVDIYSVRVSEMLVTLVQCASF